MQVRVQPVSPQSTSPEAGGTHHQASAEGRPPSSFYQRSGAPTACGALGTGGCGRVRSALDLLTAEWQRESTEKEGSASHGAAGTHSERRANQTVLRSDGPSAFAQELEGHRPSWFLPNHWERLCAKSPEGAHPCRSPHNDHTGQAPWTGLCSELFRHIKARFITRQLSRRGCSVIPTFRARQRGHGEAKSAAPGLTKGVQCRASDSEL